MGWIIITVIFAPLLVSVLSKVFSFASAQKQTANSASDRPFVAGGSALSSAELSQHHLFDDEDLTSTSSSGMALSRSSLFDEDTITEHTSAIDDDPFDNSFSINPANGLPMMGCVDIEGNAFGTDSMRWDDHLSSMTSMDDCCTSSSSMFDDSSMSSSFSSFDD
jgi:hypothetical protein